MSCEPITVYIVLSLILVNKFSRTVTDSQIIVMTSFKSIVKIDIISSVSYHLGISHSAYSLGNEFVLGGLFHIVKRLWDWPSDIGG